MKIKKNRPAIGALNLCLVLLLVCRCKSTEVREPDSGWHGGGPNFVHSAFHEDEVVYAFPGKKQPKLTFTARLIKGASVLEDFIDSKLYRGLSCEDFASDSFKAISELYLSTVQILIQTEGKEGKARKERKEDNEKKNAPENARSEKAPKSAPSENAEPSDSTPEMSPSLNWTWGRYDGGTVFGSIVVLRKYGEYYEGGAHPRHERNYYVFDLANEKQVIFRDLIRPNAQNDLTALVKKELISTYTKMNQENEGQAAATDAAPGESAPKNSKNSKNSENTESAALQDLGFFSDDVELPIENFYLSKEGLVFCWGEYEIAPYYFGIIELTLPLEQIKTFLSKEGMRVFDIVGRS